MSENKKLLKTVFQIMEEGRKVQAVKEEFYPNGILADISVSSDKNILANVIAKAQVSSISAQESMAQEQMAEHCIQVRENVKKSKSDSVEIQFDLMTQMFLGRRFELGNTICKVCTYAGDTSPTFIFFKRGSSLDVRLFIGGENAVAVMAIRNDKDQDYFIRLSEFHMVSFQENTDPRKEVGLVTSYVWLTARVYSSVVLASTLDPIKSLLLSEWLQTEWQKVKDAGEQSSKELSGGDGNG